MKRLPNAFGAGIRLVTPMVALAFVSAGCGQAPGPSPTQPPAAAVVAAAPLTAPTPTPSPAPATALPPAPTTVPPPTAAPTATRGVAQTASESAEPTSTPATATPTASPEPVATLTPVPPVPAAPTGVETPTEVSASALADAAWEDLLVLTNQQSPRSSATDEEKAAADYLVREFEAAGYEAGLQTFTVQVLSRDAPVFALTAPEQREVRGFPIGLSGTGQASGPLVDVGKAFEADLPQQDLSGKIALIERGDITFEEKVGRVAKAGALAAVVYNNRPGGFGGTLMNQGAIPAVAIARERGDEIKELMALGEVAATVSVIMETLESRNVIAEKPGTAESGGVVVLGGHYDTVPDVPGANDNGSGIATILTMAREISDRSYPFTLRFVAFGSEELGLLGSRHYVEALAEEERESVIAMLNFDALGTGDVTGVLGSLELTGKIVEIGEDKGLDVERRFRMEGGSDHASFAEAGIPVVFFLADDFSRIHTPEDKLEFVRRELMGTSAALAVHLLDTLAEP